LGNRIRALSIIVAVFLLGSFGLYQESFAITPDEINERIINESLSGPTFGLNHENTFTITNNFHTPFTELQVNIGQVNSFEAKVYAENGMKVQEFLFGIPNVGEAHLAELGIEVWYDFFGEMQDIKIFQKSNVIDIDSINATHQKTKCLSSNSKQNCNVTKVSMIFLEPLRDKVMAIKAIDYNNKYQITYLNEGFDVSGESLYPNTMMISSPERDEGLIPLTQTEKYSSHWIAEDGRIFEKNNFGSLKQINISFEKVQDTGEPRTRLHSGFGGKIADEQMRATDVFEATELLSELPDFIPNSPPKSGERIDKEMKEKIAYEQMRATDVFEASELLSELSDYISPILPVISERIDKEMKEKIAYEQMRATDVFDASELFSELPDSFGHLFPEAGGRMTEEMKVKMLEQEEIAQSILNKYTSQITYLKKEVEITGESLNPMQTYLIPTNVRDGGLIQVTQTAKYSTYWIAEDGRIFEMNNFGSFRQVGNTFERFLDTGNPYTKAHSGFGGIIAYEQKRELGVFDSSEFISELPDSFANIFPEAGDRMTEEMKVKMLDQEEIAKKIIDESKVQARW